MTVLSAALLLFLILDPLGNIPVFLSVLKPLTPKRQRIVLFLIGIRMIFPRPEGLMGELPGGEPFIVPLAIPLVAGPSGMAAVMLMGSNEPTRLWDWSLALMIAWGATAVILFSATVLYKWLGRSALTALERLMGMLLVAISVQMVLDGVGTYLKLQPNI